ncbi:BdrQ protein (plasmid) [Borrelia recurrentis]|nr:BdrQ protein [Borrelia recurrentis]
MDVAVTKEQLIDDNPINKSSIRSERVKKDYHNIPFDGHIISYYVLEEKFDLLQDRMMDNFHYLDDKINILKIDLNEKIDGVESRLSARMDKLDAKIEAVKSDVGQINSRLTFIESKLGFIEGKLGFIEGKLGFKGQLISSLTVIATLAVSYFVVQMFVTLGKYLGIS